MGTPEDRWTQSMVGSHVFRRNDLSFVRRNAARSASVGEGGQSKASKNAWWSLGFKFVASTLFSFAGFMSSPSAPKKARMRHDSSGDSRDRVVRCPIPNKIPRRARPDVLDGVGLKADKAIPARRGSPN